MSSINSKIYEQLTALAKSKANYSFLMVNNNIINKTSVNRKLFE